MKVYKNSVVTIDYVLTDNNGVVLDRSEAQNPLSYIQGAGQLIPGLEAVMEGKVKGDQFKTSIAPQDAYGERRNELIQVVSRDQFENNQDIEAGMQFEAETDDGVVLFQVVSVDKDRITLDGNHPLSGITLNFDVSVIDIREATQEELEHGHVHGHGCQHH